MEKERKEKEKLTAAQNKKNNQEEKQSEKDKKRFSKLIGMPFRNPGSAYSSKRSSKGTSVPEETDSGVLLCLY